MNSIRLVRHQKSCSDVLNIKDTQCRVLNKIRLTGRTRKNQPLRGVVNMFTSDKPYTFDSVVRMVLGLVFVVGMIWLLGFLSSALVPFVSALLLAYLLNPFTTLIQRVVRNRGLAVFITMAGLVGLVVGIVWIVVPMMASEFTHMGRVLTDLANNAEFANRVRENLPDDIWKWLQSFAQDKDIQAFFTSDGATSVLDGVMDKVLPGITGFLKGTASFLAGFLGVGIIILYVVFLLADFGKIKENWKEYLPGLYRERIASFLSEFEHTMSLYFRGQVTVALLVGVLMSIGFVIIGLPLAVALGMFIGILNIAPYLGTIGIVPAVLLAAISSLEAGESPWMGIGLVLLVISVVQVIQDGILVPKIQGESLGLSPWMIILALSIWGKLLGFLGLLIALPMTCLCLSYYRQMLARREVVVE